MTETTGKTCLPCCCAWMPMPWPLTWRPGRWRARHARPTGWPGGDTAGNGRSGCAAGAPRGCGRGGRAAGPAAGHASCCRPGVRRAARTASRSSAPRRAWRWPGTATGPSPPRSASRPGPCAAGCAGCAPVPGSCARTPSASWAAWASTPRAAVGARGLAAGRRAERRGRRRGLRQAQLRARAGDDLAAGRAARPGPLPDARPRQLITCRWSRAPPCPQPRRRRSPRPAAARAATP